MVPLIIQIESKYSIWIQFEIILMIYVRFNEFNLTTNKTYSLPSINR